MEFDLFNPKSSNSLFERVDEETPRTHPAKEAGDT